MGLLYRTVEPGEKTIESDLFTHDGLILRPIEEKTDELEEWREIKASADAPMPELTKEEQLEMSRAFMQTALKTSPELMDELIGKETSIISLSGIIAYEINSAWWAKYMIFDWMQSFSGQYFGWKTRRKWRRFLDNSKLQTSTEIPIR